MIAPGSFDPARDHSRWWVTFATRRPAYVQAKGEEAAREIAGAVGTVVSCRPLPYPTSAPGLQVLGSTNDTCPNFCYSPDHCAGRVSCPQRYACSE